MCNHFGKNFKELEIGKSYIADYSGKTVCITKNIGNGFYIANNGVTYTKTGCVPRNKNKDLPVSELLHKLVVNVK